MIQSIITHPGFANSVCAFINHKIPMLAISPNWGMSRCILSMMIISSGLPDEIKTGVFEIFVNHADRVDPSQEASAGLKNCVQSIVEELRANSEAMHLISSLGEPSFPVDMEAVRQTLDEHVEH